MASLVKTIPHFGGAHDCPHTPNEDPTFQESSLFVWHDLKAGVGGFWRLGQEPNVSALNSCFGIFADDGLRFRSNKTGAPMSPADRGETHMGVGRELRVELDTLSVKADFPDCEAALQFEDFNPRYDYMALIGVEMPEGHTGHHFEVSGRMTGRVRLGDREVEIDALGYRDRSWGGRHWDVMRGTRWWPIVFGPDLCVHTMVSVMKNGDLASWAHIIRNGEVSVTSDVSVLATIEGDAISPRSALARMTFPNGETIELVHEPSDGIVLHVRGYTAIESIGRVRWGDRVGMSNFEISTNPAGGSQPPVLTLGANNGDGLSRRAL
jgi:hypothetical protein